ncbi:hypothetical protein PIS_082 [Saccharomonospora phage PIS 136]|nr:hypothetical protein PIS_082 [Saccharomonospora phage PIS 136]
MRGDNSEFAGTLAVAVDVLVDHQRVDHDPAVEFTAVVSAEFAVEEGEVVGSVVDDHGQAVAPGVDQMHGDFVDDLCGGAAVGAGVVGGDTVHRSGFVGDVHTRVGEPFAGCGVAGGGVDRDEGGGDDPSGFGVGAGGFGVERHEGVHVPAHAAVLPSAEATRGRRIAAASGGGTASPTCRYCADLVPCHG